MALPADSAPYVHVSVPNRSLAPLGRRLVIGTIAATMLCIAAGAALIGAWPVMPFAGLEVLLVAVAFRVVQIHDEDFERLEIDENEVRVEARRASRTTRFVAHRPWAKVVVRDSGMRCTLRLAYRGRSEPLGRLLSDEGRRALAARLRGRIAVTAN
ncbi:MAG TPA: DUF2244 domain-containing protein [Usitatibacter sp.]|nr:DUF2244 domain-containing protein [Usitatibacter sp.]